MVATPQIDMERPSGARKRWMAGPWGAVGLTRWRCGSARSEVTERQTEETGGRLVRFPQERVEYTKQRRPFSGAAQRPSNWPSRKSSGIVAVIPKSVKGISMPPGGNNSMIGRVSWRNTR